MVTRLGNRVMDEINRVTAVTPGALTALVLLSHNQRGLPHRELVARAEKLLGVAARAGARISSALRTPAGSLRPESIREAAQMFVGAELVEVHHPDEPVGALGGVRRPSEAGEGASYLVPQGKRLILDTSKNIIVHFYVERALVAVALLAAQKHRAGVDWVRDRVQALSRLFKFEFRFRADAPFSEIFEQTLAQMIDDRELARDQDELFPGEGRDGWSGTEWLLRYAAILQNFLEGYWIAARTLEHLQKMPLTEKDLLKRAIAVGNRAFLSGELERQEAVSKSILQNAFQAFVDHGFLALRDDKLDLGEAHSSAAATAEISDRIRGYLPEVRA
jgi:glycerol-3-phosphate O-acyltransferase